MLDQGAERNQVDTVVNGFDQFSDRFWHKVNSYEDLTQRETTLIKHHIFVSLAGGVIDRKRGCFSDLAVEQDNRCVSELALILTAGDTEAASKYIDHTLNRLLKFVLDPATWRRIEAISKELIKKETLKYEEVLYIYSVT